MISPENVSEIEIDRVLGGRSLRAFMELAWHLVEPARPFIGNYHIDAICEHLEAVSRREIRRLVINVPPGTSKSITCGVMWPAWDWIHTPRDRFITASFADIISKRDAKKSMAVMESDWYQARWGNIWRRNKDIWSSSKYANNKAGFRMAVTVRGSVTGEHADHQLVDDPIKPLDARGAHVDSAALQACIEWWDETMATRIIDPTNSTRTIIMQRLHDRDLAGYVLGGGEYVHLNLPMRYEPRCVIKVPHPCSLKEDAKGNETPPTPIRFKDLREDGELLWPERFPESIQPERKRELGTRGVAAQDQQRPTPSGGSIYKREYVHFWREFPKAQYGRAEFVQSWDCTFKGLDESDFVVGQVWIRLGGLYYLVDQVRDQMGVGATCRAVKTLSAKWPRAIRKLVEDKANGPAVIELMKTEIPGLKPVDPKGGKIARANAVEPLWESGNVLIPDPSLGPQYSWVHDFVEELVDFNGDPGRHDDQVDGMTQALVYLHEKTASTYETAMRNIGSLSALRR